MIVDKLATEAFLSREQDPRNRRRWILKADPVGVTADAVYADHARRTPALLKSTAIRSLMLPFTSWLPEELN